VTFTCNPKWREISEGMREAGQKPSDRADLVVRVFNMKLEELLHNIKAGIVFGPCSAGIPTTVYYLLLGSPVLIPSYRVLSCIIPTSTGFTLLASQISSMHRLS
jgi:hypothetical protein